MLDHIRHNLQEKCHLDPSRPLLVAVSGGPDSLALFDLLHRLGYRLVVAHLDHGLRPQSSEESRYVQTLAEERGLPFVSERQDVATFAEVNGLSLEEAARTVRYRFLFRYARENNMAAVAVGHNADDQIETVLMHLMRGAGLSGLRGMPFHSLPNPWSQSIPLVRPLLDIWREDIEDYVRERALRPTMDLTNLDTRYFRNRLRHELIPHLENYNPNIKEILWRTSDIAREDYTIILQAVDAAWESCLLETGADYLAFHQPSLQTQSLGIQRHLLRRGINSLSPGLRDIDYAALERAVDFLNRADGSHEIDLIAGLRLRTEAERLWLATWEADLPGMDWPQLPAGTVLQLPVTGAAPLTENWLIISRELSNLAPHEVETLQEQMTATPDPYQAWLDADKLPHQLQVRTRRPGERFQPLGMGGHSIKVSDLMINAKLPARARENWPIVSAGDDIVWLLGLRVAHPFRLTAQTTSIIHLQLVKKEQGAA